MNTNREAIYSLVSLLVKKAGFDVSKNEAEEELKKTKENLEKLSHEKVSVGNKKNLDKLIEDLKVREAFWENNAEVIGRSLLEDYNSGAKYHSVKHKIDSLVALANEGTQNLEFSYIYTRSIELEKAFKELESKVKTHDYTNYDEKEMDTKYKSYLENKLKSLDEELESIDKELDNLRDIEAKDVNIVNKIRDYNETLSNNLSKLIKVSENTIHTDIAFDVWEKLETTKSDLEEKLESSVDALEKTENLLAEVRKNRMGLNNRKDVLGAEKTRCTAKLANINKSLDEDSYMNLTERIMDVSNLELARLELESLKNKKEVIYVDANKVREELIKEWENAPKDRTPLETKEEDNAQEQVTTEENKVDNSTEEAAEEEITITKVTEEDDLEKTNIDLDTNINIEEDNDKTVEIKIEKKNKFDLEW